jgi:hypothetical protein
MLRVLRKTYNISIEVQEPHKPSFEMVSTSGIGSVSTPDPFWDQEDLRFLRSTKADEVVEAVRKALEKEPMFSKNNVKVKLDRFGYE